MAGYRRRRWARQSARGPRPLHGSAAVLLLLVVALRWLHAWETTSPALPGRAEQPPSAEHATVHPEPAASPPLGAALIQQSSDVTANTAPSGSPGLSQASSTGRPAGAKLLTLYEVAAAQYGVSPGLLRALHQVESSSASEGCIPNLAGSGAVGPFQFMPPTFRAYAVDADGDGRADVCSFADSLFSAARYLQALGADADPASPASQRALKLYGTDPMKVVALAR